MSNWKISTLQNISNFYLVVCDHIMKQSGHRTACPVQLFFFLWENSCCGFLHFLWFFRPPYLKCATKPEAIKQIWSIRPAVVDVWNTQTQKHALISSPVSRIWSHNPVHNIHGLKPRVAYLTEAVYQKMHMNPYVHFFFTHSAHVIILYEGDWITIPLTSLTLSRKQNMKELIVGYIMSHYNHSVFANVKRV